VPGAFTGGTNHFAHSGRPADEARAAEYDAGPHKDFGDQVQKAFAAIVPDDADARATLRYVLEAASKHRKAAQIKSQIEDTTSDYDREKLQERLAKLAGGVAVIRVGGASEVEVKEKKDLVDDALNATRAAVEEGVLPGGSVPLLRAIKALDGIKVENPDQQTGVDIVRKAIQTPARQIIDNAGDDGAVIVGKLIENTSYAYGYNAQTGEYGDLIKLGIIDPTKVVRIALQDAASVAGLVITTEAIVVEARRRNLTPCPAAGWAEWAEWAEWITKPVPFAHDFVRKAPERRGLFRLGVTAALPDHTEGIVTLAKYNRFRGRFGSMSTGVSH
jgi:TCP-1/cpn60 chaperonin family